MPRYIGKSIPRWKTSVSSPHGRLHRRYSTTRACWAYVLRSPRTRCAHSAIEVEAARAWSGCAGSPHCGGLTSATATSISHFATRPMRSSAKPMLSDASRSGSTCSLSVALQRSRAARQRCAVFGTSG